MQPDRFSTSAVAVAAAAFSFVAFSFVAVAKAHAQDVSGTWDLTFDNDISTNNCEYAGTATFVQAQTGLVSGSVDMDKTAGDPACPAKLAGPLDTSSGTSGAAFVWIVLDNNFAGGVVIVDNTVSGAFPGDTLDPTIIPNATDNPPTVVLGTMTGTRTSGPPPPQHYVLDGMGGVHAGGGAPVMNPATPYFGFDVAVDLEVAVTGYYVLDVLGGVHAGGGAPVLSPASPYFGFSAATDLELVTTGYYVLDIFGAVHAGGGAPAITSPTSYFGFDIARALAIR